MSKFAGFNSVELRKPTRSMFDLSHEVRLSCRMGKLVPVFISEALPNDTFMGSTEVLVKFAPLIAPIMHRVHAYIHNFFVPNRLLWKDWEQFITGGQYGPGVTVPPVPPNFSVPAALNLGTGMLDKGSLYDYLGGALIPDANVGFYSGRTLDMMPFAACYKVWYDYYRDRNYVPDHDALPMASGSISVIGASIYSTFLKLQTRCWEHDYFTSSLPWTQRGAEVLMPISASGDLVVSDLTGLPVGAGRNLVIDPLAAGQLASSNPAFPVAGVEQARIQIDESEISINDFRRAMRLQEWMERNALAGSRYNESIMAHFARRTSDGRLQRAEYLGGSKAIVQVGEVMTTAYSEDSVSEVVPPGNPAGKAGAYTPGNRWSYNCEEHGFVVSFMSVMPTSGYMQGLPRMFQARNSFLDYPWPTFAHLGEQEVYRYEIYGGDTSFVANRSEAPVFGYQSRYADWKFIGSRAAGDFRESLDHWHLTRKFSNTPVLNGTFVQFEDALQDRIFNVAGVDTLWCYVHNNIKVKRSLPYFGTPTI